MQYLWIIIPAYNEGRTIKELLTRVIAVDLGKQLRKKIIVVDDGSSDETAKMVKDVMHLNKDVKLIRHKKNQGKGSAIRTGIAHAADGIILIQDADLEYNPEDYRHLLEPFKSNDVKIVYGTRYHQILNKEQRNFFLKTKYKKSYLMAYLGGRILTFVANMLYNANITDEATCYKIFRSEVLKGIKLNCIGFEFCPEITAKVKKRGYSIVEVPIMYNPRSFDEGKKINYKDGLQALWTLIKYRFSD